MTSVRHLRILLGDILVETYAPGNGGYTANFGPMTFGRMLDEASKDPAVRAHLEHHRPEWFAPKEDS
jgi:hypothetical protein